MRLLLLAVVLTGCGPMMMMTADSGTVCRGATRSPPNLLENAEFECDDTPAPWSAFKGTLELASGGRSGRAAKITVTQAGALLYTRDLNVGAGMKLLCLTAFISGTAPFMKSSVLLLDPQQRVEQADQVFGDFRRTPLGRPLQIPSNAASRVQVLFEAQTNRTDGQSAVAGDTLVIDDVDLWESNSNCTETR